MTDSGAKAACRNHRAGPSRHGATVEAMSDHTHPSTNPTPQATNGTHTISITLSAKAFDRLAHVADVQDRAVEEVASDAVIDQLNGEIYQLLYRDRDEWIAGLEGWSQRLAQLMRDLADLPRHDAARMIALAHAQVAGAMPEQYFQRQVEQLTEHGLERIGIRWGRREDGSAGPLQASPVEAVASPAQWDALRRIGAPGSINDAMQAVLATGIDALDPGRLPHTEP
jgi:hypothetical protein